MREPVSTMNRSIAFSSILALGVALAGCTGMVSGSDGNAPGPNGTGATGSGATGTGGAGSGTGTAGTGTGGTGVPGTPGVALMHRLNTAEYNATVTDVLGTTAQPATANWRGGEVDGFDNIAAVLGVDENQYALYVDAAEQLADEVFASAALKAKVLTCATQDDMACVKTIIQQTGLKVFRRPVTDAEVTTYSKVYTGSRAQGEDHSASIHHVLWSLLSSAEFLFRIELDNGVATKHPVTGYELASRLSYFLWSSAPDDALLAAAPNLSADAAITAQVDRMLADTNKSGRLVTNFAGQWLGGRKIVPHAVDTATYPKWSTDIANAAANEVYAYFNEFLRTETPWSQFLSKDMNFVTPALAGLYGITGVNGTTAQRVEFPGDNRAGFMSLVGFLAVSSVDRRSSPTLRGKWVLVNLLCDPPQPPPPGVPELETGMDGPKSTNVRDILEAHRAAPACKACHNVLDPFGLALEQFDGIGVYRTAYPDGSAINPATELPKSDSFPNGLQFTGLDGAQSTIAADPRFQGCITQKLYTYGLGRSLSTEDKANSAAITKNWTDSGNTSIKSLLQKLATADAFRTRTPAM